MKQNKSQVKQDVHKIINWIVSIVVIAFAIWSLYVNAGNQSLVKQANQVYSDVDTRIGEINALLNEVKDVCTQATTGIPTTTISNQ